MTSGDQKDIEVGVIECLNPWRQLEGKHVRSAKIWEKIDSDTQRMIDDLVTECRTDLKAAGFPAFGSRFPYGMHHEFYRVRVRLGKRKLHHAEIAAVLNMWMASRSDKVDYARQAVCGAIKAMLVKRPELVGRIPASARHAMLAVGEGYDFLDWAKKLVKENPGGFLPEDTEESRDEMIDGLIEAVS